VIDAALDAGVTLLDTADIYGGGKSEELLGRVLEGRREAVVLATKFGMDMGDGKGPRGSAGYVRQALAASLRRLRTDVIDLYWYHRPDGVTPIAETLSALDELVQAGKVRAIGASNFNAEQIEEADSVARERELTPFCAIQNEYSLLVRDAEREVLPLCERLGIGFVPYFPLASGLLTGKYRRGLRAPAGARLSGREEIATDEQFELLAALDRYANERHLSMTEVAIGALLARPAVSSVIAGATSPLGPRRGRPSRARAHPCACRCLIRDRRPEPLPLRAAPHRGTRPRPWPRRAGRCTARAAGTRRPRRACRGAAGS
jgi:aryl-alcohol dehydrogenase-like predicted oxidoreductase